MLISGGLGRPLWTGGPMTRVSIIMYHYIRDLEHSRYPAITGLDAALFRRQLDFLRHNFTIIRMEELLAALAGGNLPDNAALLTFDDGYLDHYTVVFPLLVKFGLQGSFFPPARVLESKVVLNVNKIHFMLASADAKKVYQALRREIRARQGPEFHIPDLETFVEKYGGANRFNTGEALFIKQTLQKNLPEGLRELITDQLFREFVGVDEAVLAGELYCDAEQLLTMKKFGMFIGLHGYNHGWLGETAPAEYERDIDLALSYMDGAGLIDRKAWVMNYPYGSWNHGLIDCLRARGCLAGLTTKPDAADLERDGRWLLPRFDTNDFPPKSENFRFLLDREAGGLLPEAGGPRPAPAASLNASMTA